ncbi:hypothetical protein ABVN23_19260 [Pseudomonas fluorescens]|uniref:hypothetical protein n=1 Tax=Pseudomonas TaxID=286 RepID=UPI0021187C4D|nr:hypothetical protein [Pseudomonas sp. Pse1]
MPTVPSLTSDQWGHARRVVLLSMLLAIAFAQSARAASLAYPIKTLLKLPEAHLCPQ